MKRKYDDVLDKVDDRAYSRGQQFEPRKALSVPGRLGQLSRRCRDVRISRLMLYCVLSNACGFHHEVEALSSTSHQLRLKARFVAS